GHEYGRHGGLVGIPPAVDEQLVERPVPGDERLGRVVRRAGGGRGGEGDRVVDRGRGAVDQRFDRGQPAAVRPGPRLRSGGDRGQDGGYKHNPSGIQSPHVLSLEGNETRASW